MTFIIPISKGRSFISVLARLVLDVVSYFIWKERNSRLLKKNSMSPDQLVGTICSTIRLKLVTFHFKNVVAGSRSLLAQWKVPDITITHDGSTG